MPWLEHSNPPRKKLWKLDGQLALPLEESRATADDIFERAEDCELNGDLIRAERWYRLASKMERTDPVASFNLANVLDALGREQEAALAYQEAVARDPAFAEAWVNLGILHERRGAADAGKRCYARAIAACPESSEGLHNFALLLTRANSFAEAVPLWERYIATKPTDSSRALRLLALCRIGSNASAEASVCV